MTAPHVIFGTGPVGCWTARSLVDRGLPVRAVNRSGLRPALLPAEVDLVAADAGDPAQALRAAEGAATVYQALNPPYEKWHDLFPGLQTARAGRRRGDRRAVRLRREPVHVRLLGAS